MHNENWDDLRFVLAVADTGTISAAARRLGVNHATVLRRVAAFEERYGAPLFARRSNGYTLLPERARVVEALRDVEGSVNAVARLMAGAETGLTGEVRITSTDTLCQSVLPNLLATLRLKAPDLNVHLISANAHLDLARLEADIAIRPALELPRGVRGSKAGVMRFGAFALPGTEALPWLEPEGALGQSAPARWLQQNIPVAVRRSGADSYLVLAEMCRAGLGRALLPGFLVSEQDSLIPVPGPKPAIEVPVWVTSHVDLAEMPRLKATHALLVPLLAEALSAASPEPVAASSPIRAALR